MQVLNEADVLLVLDVYSAGEKKIPGADSRSLCRSIRQLGKLDPIYVGDEAKVSGLLAGIIEAGDIVITQGAGSVGALSRTLANEGLVGN